MIEIFNIVGSSEHLLQVEFSGNFRAITFSRIDEKLLFMKIQNENIVAQIPNYYEKT